MVIQTWLTVNMNNAFANRDLAVRGSRTWAVYEIIILLDTTNILHIFTCNYFSVSLAVTPIYMYRLGYWPLPRLLKNLKFYKGHKKTRLTLLLVQLMTYFTLCNVALYTAVLSVAHTVVCALRSFTSSFRVYRSK